MINTAGITERKYKRQINGKAPPMLLLLIPLISGLVGCDSDSNSSGEEPLQAVVSASSHLTTTGNIHLDLSDSVLGASDSVVHNLTVTDLETGDVVYQLEDVPTSKIKNLKAAFSPIASHLEHWKAHAINREFEISYTIEDANGATHQVVEDFTISESVAIGDVSEARGVLQRTSFNITNNASDSDTCNANCITKPDALVVCTLPAVRSCDSVTVQSASDGPDLLKLVNEAIKDKAYDYNPVTGVTSMWLQTAGGYGGKMTGRVFEGGFGGFAQTVKTASDYLASGDNDAILYYYIADTGLNGKTATGGPSSLVTTRAITDGISNLTHVTLIAGGGGGGGKDNPGGHGGRAFAQLGFPAYGNGINSSLGGFGGNIVLENGVASEFAGGEPDGHDGIGGAAGSGTVGWINADISGFLGDNGKGGHQPGGGGGGGLGGGGSSSGSSLHQGRSGGGGGGGSYATAASLDDEQAPSDIDALEDVDFNARGWFRFVFNTVLNKDIGCYLNKTTKHVICVLPEKKNQVALADILTAAQKVERNISSTTPVWLQAFGAAGGPGHQGSLGGRGGVAMTGTTLQKLRSPLYYYPGKRGTTSDYAGNGGASTIISFVDLDLDAVSKETVLCMGGNQNPLSTECPADDNNVLLLAGGGGGGGSGPGNNNGGAGGTANAQRFPMTNFAVWRGDDGAAPVDSSGCYGTGGYGGIGASDDYTGTRGSDGIGGKGGISHENHTEATWLNTEELYLGDTMTYGMGGVGVRSHKHPRSGGSGGGGWGGGGGGRVAGGTGCGGGGGGSFATHITLDDDLDNNPPKNLTGTSGDGKVLLYFDISSLN